MRLGYLIPNHNRSIHTATTPTTVLVTNRPVHTAAGPHIPGAVGSLVNCPRARSAVRTRAARSSLLFCYGALGRPLGRVLVVNCRVEAMVSETVGATLDDPAAIALLFICLITRICSQRDRGQGRAWGSGRLARAIHEGN